MLSLKFHRFFGNRHTTLSSSVSVAPPKVPQLRGKACFTFQKHHAYFISVSESGKKRMSSLPRVRWRHCTLTAVLPHRGKPPAYSRLLPTLRFLSLCTEWSWPHVKPKQSSTSHRGKVILTRWELKFPLPVKPCCPHLPIRLEACCDAIFPWLARLPGFDKTLLQNQLFIKDVLHPAEIKEPEQMSLNIFPPCNDGK